MSLIDLTLAQHDSQYLFLQVVVVTDEETKKALHPVAWNQPQVLQCSHLLVFCARTDTPTRAGKFRFTGAGEANTLYTLETKKYSKSIRDTFYQ